MKHLIIVFLVLILFGSQESFGQSTVIKGCILDYTTGEKVPPIALIQYIPNNRNGEKSTQLKSDGCFELEFEVSSGYVSILFPGTYYPIKIYNIPKGLAQIDFGEIKLVRNHLGDHVVIGGPCNSASEEQMEQDEKIRQDVLKNYSIYANGKELTPYFEGIERTHQKIAFDFNNCNVD